MDRPPVSQSRHLIRYLRLSSAGREKIFLQAEALTELTRLRTFVPWLQEVIDRPGFKELVQGVRG